ncbi:MAG: o-succinylbenzoate synthase [Opitutaceae bacterium]
MTVDVQMSGQISFAPYSRAFRQPLQTAHGLWSERRGFIVRIEDSDGVGYGEIAPIPDFGTETVLAAAAFLARFAQNPSLSVPVELPCCAFGLSAAWAQAKTNCSSAPRSGTVASFGSGIAALLPAGESALSALGAKVAIGFNTFKWKIGVEPIEVELELMRKLMSLLPPSGQLRIDANGGLSDFELKTWLSALSPFEAQLEYLEQPMPPGNESVMQALAAGSGISIALDESLNGSEAVHWLDNWQGPLVVKPALMGNVGSLVKRLKPVADRIVLSSVFETGVGVANAISIGGQLPGINRAVGFDTCDAFDDGLDVTPEDVWKQIPYLI